MTNVLLSHLLIIILLFPAAAWNLSRKNGRVNTSVVFIPLALLCSVVLILLYGIDLMNLLLLVCALIFFLTNFWQLFRVFNGLRTDSTPFLRFVAVFKCLVLIALCSCCVFFRPEPKPADVFWSAPLVREEYAFDGSGSHQQKKRLPLDMIPVITVMYPENSGENPVLPVFLYLPDVFSNTADIQATLTGLAAKGFMVVTADSGGWAAQRVRPFVLRVLKFLPVDFSLREERLREEKAREFELFLTVCRSLAADGKFKGRLVYAVGDGYVKELAETAQKRSFDLYAGVFGINTDEYPIPGYLDGYGNLGVFHVFEAFLLGVPRDSRWKQARRIAESAEIFADGRSSGVASRGGALPVL